MEKNTSKIKIIFILAVVSLLLAVALFNSGWLKKEEEEKKLEQEVEIEPGRFYYFKTEGTKLKEMPLESVPLPEEAEKALKKTPEWLRKDLRKKFEELSQVPVQPGSFSSPYLYDFDSDCKYDLAVGSEGGALFFKENVGTVFRPIFKERSVFPNTEDHTFLAPALLDYENDGDTDLVVGCGDGTLKYYENIGTNKNPVWLQREDVFSDIDVGKNAHPVFADMDGDGDLDLTLGGLDPLTNTARIYYYENTGSKAKPVWERNNLMYLSLSAYQVEDYPYPALADLDNDGDLDLTLGGKEGGLRYFENQFEAGGVVWRERFSLYLDIDVGEHATPSFADLNGDLCYDLILGSRNGALFYFENKGTPESPHFVSLSSGEIYHSGTMGEVAGDTIHQARKVFLGPGTLNFDRKVKEVVMDDVLTYANLILEAPEYCVDELSFIVAHTSVPVLWAMTGTMDLKDPECEYDPDILLKHVVEHYKLKGKLRYADLIEKGDYTTIQYINGEGEKKEMPRDVYYWYVVHPRCRYEAPGYTHGDFWREYLRYDDKYGKSLFDVVKDAENIHQAVYKLTKWMSGFMDFGYNTTDKTPIEIYDIHYGSCGEYSILTNALGRAVFIPTRLANNWGEDHVWNEFYDEVSNGTWHHWDTTVPAIDDPEMYERDWGKDISTVWSIRGDDYAYGITEKYTPTCRLTITVVDRNGTPVDGACVVMESEYFVRHNPYYWPVPTISFWNYTDQDGKCTFELGENYYTIDVMSEIGNFHRGYPNLDEHNPLGSYHAVEGRVEKITLTIDGTMPNRGEGQKETKPQGKEFEISFKLKLGVVKAQSIITYPDDSCVIEGNPYHQKVEASLEVFVCDENNFERFLKGYDFKCVVKMNNVMEGKVVLPKGEWYLVFSNVGSLGTVKEIDVWEE